ncbi:hypothetical protein FSOLCH5_008460 [Fusarium solani]
MAQDKVIPTEQGLAGLDLNDPQIHELIQRAQDADAADKKLTVREALKKYKKAVFWACLLSVSLIMEGYDLVMIGSFYGQTQFQQHFGEYSEAEGKKVITPAWQSGLSNSAQVGQLAGLLINAYSQDRYGARLTMMVFMAYLICMIFIIAFAPSLSILALGEALCGVAWGVFQTLSTTYACEVVPTVLRPYVTAWVCMCWGFGILLSSGVVRATSDIKSNLAWRLPFYLQWIWPVPLFLVAYFAPESPWNAVRRGKIDEARQSLMRLATASADKEAAVEASLAYIRHTTELEKAETQGASFWECFKGTNLRRTEINCVVWAAQILCGNAILGFVIVFLQAAGWSEVQSFNLNISLSACYIIGGWGWGAKTGLFYAGTNLLCFIWCWFRLPETKDRTFGEIDILFENKVPARKFKYTKVDQFAQHSDYVFQEKVEHEQIE